MGIDIQAARFLSSARQLGVSYKRTATLGRQLFVATPDQLIDWFEGESKPHFSQEQKTQISSSWGKYAETFFQVLGAESVDSFDASSFEQATVLHDFNQPIAERLHAQYEAVVDCGSLEHIFNVPVALANLMKMTSVGGHLILITPANNFCGHGFYQFSPELFFRVFDQSNGFRLKRVLLAENLPDAWWWEVPDPAAIRRRVTFENRYWTHLFLVAERFEQREVFREPPQQSDYAALWRTHRESGVEYDPNSTVESATPSNRWLKRLARWKRSIKYRYLKYTRFGGKDRELMMKAQVFTRVTDLDFSKSQTK
jgi:hypothetical protein